MTAASDKNQAAPDVAADPIHVTRWGNTGPRVLMIHGGVQGSRAGGPDHFRGQRELAERGWRLVIPDRPGHGQSPTRGREDMERDAVWAAEMLGGGSHLVGHSYGGCVALAAAARHPGSVESLTLVEAPLFTLAPDDPAVRERTAQQLRLRSAALDPVSRMIEFGRRLGIRGDMLATKPSRDELVRMGESLAEARSPFDWEGARSAIEVVGARGIPVLAITGRWSPAAERVADEIAKHTDGTRLAIDAGHHFPHRETRRFNDELHEFLAAVEARAKSRPDATRNRAAPRRARSAGPRS